MTGHFRGSKCDSSAFFSINITVQSYRHTRTRPTHTSQITLLTRRGPSKAALRTGGTCSTGLAVLACTA